MGLDARVNCDCFEKGCLRTPPPFPEKIFIDEDGAPQINEDHWEVRDDECVGPGWEQVRAFNDWFTNACEHGEFTLLHHYIGSIGTVGRLRALVQDLSAKPEAEFPLVWNAVIYSGSHCCDRIEVEDVPALAEEIERLAIAAEQSFEGDSRQAIAFFCEQMRQLCAASRQVKKPICF